MNNMHRLPLPDRFYIIRVVMVLMILAIMTIQGVYCSGPVFHPFFLLAGLIYPHLLQLTLGRIEQRRRGGRFSLLIDGLFSGAVMPAIGFSTVPCLVLIVINLYNGMALGGFVLMSFVVLAMTAGLILSAAFLEFDTAAASCLPADYASYAALLIYFLVVASILYRNSTALRDHCDTLEQQKDAAELNSRRAERALAAVLPASAAGEHMKQGRVVSRSFADATLLLVEFSSPLEETLGIAKLGTIFDACDEIFSRHGIEGIRTFGRRYLAMAGQEVGPEEALVAALELVAFCKDHVIPSDGAGDQCGVHAFIHCGPVVAGMVQADRFSYDVVGSGIDELLALADAGTPSAVLISAPARNRLHRDWRLAPVSGNWWQPMFAPVEHGGV